MTRLIAAAFLLVLFTTGCAAQKQRDFALAREAHFPTGQQPVDVALGDLNGDGRPDIVTVNATSNDLTVLLNDGRGAFARSPGSPVPAGDKPHMIAIGDLNGDGKADLAVTSHDSNEVRILLGDGTGKFKPPVAVVAFTGARPHNHGLALGDVNGDGKLDITAGHQDANAIAVLLNDGHGGFRQAPGSPVQVGHWPYPHVLADVSKDGKLDLIVPLLRDNTVAVLLGDGKGGFTRSGGASPQLLPRPYWVAVADFDGDGNLDAAAMHDDVARMTVLLGDGRGGWRLGPGSPLDTGKRGFGAVASDLNGDGKLDLVFGAGEVRMLAGDGKGGFVPMGGLASPVAAHAWFVAAADVNGDGKADVVAPSPAANEVVVLTAK